MDFFRKHFAKAPAEVQRRGLGQWFEILEEKYMDLIRVNLMTVMCLCPALFCFEIGIRMKDIRLFILGVFLFILAGPAFTAMNRICMRMILRIHYWCRDDFWKCVRQEWKNSLLLTTFVTVLWGAVFYSCFMMLWLDGGISVFILMLLCIYIYFLTGFTVFCYQQLAMVDLPLKAVMKNAFLMIFSGGFRSAAMILGLMALIIWSYLHLMWAVPFLLIIGLAMIVMTCGVICRKEMEDSLDMGDKG